MTPARPAPRGNRPARDWTDTAIQWASGATAVGMFAYGVSLSYQVLHRIALAAALPPWAARLWPLGFEAFMASAALNALAEQRQHHHRPAWWQRVPWYPWALTTLTAGGSILLNWLHPAITLDPRPAGWSRWSTACHRWPRCSPGTCSCNASPTATTTTPRPRMAVLSWPGRTVPRTSRPSRTRHLPPEHTSPQRQNLPATPARASARCWPPRHPRRHWAGRRSPSRPGCRALASTPCSARNVPGQTATARRHPVTPPATTPLLGHPRLSDARIVTPCRSSDERNCECLGPVLGLGVELTGVVRPWRCQATG
jgi:hypothetical protein